MEFITAFLLSLTLSLSQAQEALEKTHEVWLTRFDKPQFNPDWVTDSWFKLKKISKYGKSLSINITLHKDVDSDDIMCEMKMFQKSGAKYMKAPADVPLTPCCKIMIASENTAWPCMQKYSNIPKSCPVHKGVLYLKDFNPDDCVPSKTVPPGLPEDYKLIVTVTRNSVQIVKFVAYAVMKKKIESA